MEGEDTRSPLEKLNERLYSSKGVGDVRPPSLSTRPPVSPEGTTWQAPPPPKQKKRIPLSVLFLIGAVAFFLIAAGISALFFFQGHSVVSTDKVDIVIQGPTTISSGTAVPLVVTIQNHNPSQIVNADITLDFPDGTRSAEDVTQAYPKYTDSLGAIPAGGSVTRTVQAVLFGSVNQSVTVPVTFTYRAPNSNAVYVKKQNYTFTITSSPLSITVQSASRIAAGEPLALSVAVRSNATTPLDNVSVAAQLPAGFITKSVTGDTKGTGPLYALGTIQPGEEKDFVVSGVLSGTDNDTRVFQFTVGTPKDDGTPQLGVAYGSAQASILISKPFLAATLSINNDNTDPTIITSSQTIAGSVTWQNTLASSIGNGQVAIQFSGSALDPKTVNSANGFYDSAHNVLIFNGSTENSLRALQPGDTGNGAFSFGLKTGSAFAALRNPTIQLSVGVAGQPGGGKLESITNTVIHTIKVSTDLALTSQILHSSGPFINTGPIAPKVNTPTTYTVKLAVTNTVNSVGGATVTMILPPYVTFTGKLTPDDGSITYDDTSRTVTWKLGDVAAGTTSVKPETAAFQISFLPSVSQRGTSPILVGNQSLTALDRFTNAQVGSVASALTTQTPSDPGYQNTFGTVAN